MTRATIPLGKVRGIRIELDYSWFLIFALITLVLAISYFPAEYPGWATGTYWIAGVITSILFFVAVVLHELGHATVANTLGSSIRRITLFIFGGAAQMSEEPKRPGDEFLIAIAGPAVSFALAGGLLLLSFVAPKT